MLNLINPKRNTIHSKLHSLIDVQSTWRVEANKNWISSSCFQNLVRRAPAFILPSAYISMGMANYWIGLNRTESASEYVMKANSLWSEMIYEVIIITVQWK